MHHQDFLARFSKYSAASSRQRNMYIYMHTIYIYIYIGTLFLDTLTNSVIYVRLAPYKHCWIYFWPSLKLYIFRWSKLYLFVGIVGYKLVPLNNVKFQQVQERSHSACKLPVGRLYTTKECVRGSQNRVIAYRCFLRFIHPLHAAFISQSCLDHAHCIVYCTQSLDFSTPRKIKGGRKIDFRMLATCK